MEKRIKTDYQTEADKLIKTIDISIEALMKITPKGFEQKDIDQFVKVYSEIKDSLVHPNPKFKNLKSLKYKEQDVFTYFQEASGPTVEEFWRLIKESQLDYKRVNPIGKILKRKKIKNEFELEIVIDTMIPLHQEGLINDEESENLKLMIGEYEKKKK